MFCWTNASLVEPRSAASRIVGVLRSSEPFDDATVVSLARKDLPEVRYGPTNANFMLCSGVMLIPDKMMSTCPASSAGSRSTNGIGARRSFTCIASAMALARSISSPMISPVLVVMLSGGMLAAVPTTSSPFVRIRPRTDVGKGPAPAVVAGAHPAARVSSIIRQRASRVGRTSAHLHELLEAAQPGRMRLVPVPVAPVGERHLADVDVAA